MKNINLLGFFDEYFLLDRLTQLKDPLVKLESHVDWTIFAPVLDLAFSKAEKHRRAGRPPFDKVLMFKILVLQSLYGLSDDAVEFQITDRRSFMRFLGLKISDKVPDAKTIWSFRETLIRENLIDRLFEAFNAALDRQGVFTNTGQIIDASFVEVPKQRNSRDENRQIKEGKTPETWKAEPNKLRQKDLDARWTKKNNISYYGFKNHIKADEGTKLIKNYVITPASVHDSQALDALLSHADAGQKLYADSAYVGSACEESVSGCQMENEVNEKAFRNKPLSIEQKELNRKKSKVRARVEHVFGFMTNTMDAMFIHTIGIIRGAAKIAMNNLTYNLMRCVQLNKKIIAGAVPMG